jgi:filamentous hemagglutinin family protein
MSDRTSLGWQTVSLFGYGITVSLCLGLVVAGAPAIAQLVPDNTLGAESSRVSPGQIREIPNERIEGGAIRGSSLFHSFQEFNVGEGRGVYFANPAGIETILSRVTGTNRSDIFGRLGVLGNADLFLLNPNGIVFGPNATLDIRGSFVATTADRFTFPGGETFSASDPQAAPLLSVNVTPGLQYGRLSRASGEALAPEAGTIVNQGNLSVGQNLTLGGENLALQGQLRAGQDLHLRATDTLQIRDSATLPFIANAGRHLRIQGNQSVDIFALNHPQSGLFSGGDIRLRSPNPVGADAHFFAGRSFRVERLDGRLAPLFSPNDPVIRARGDVSFQSYRGASLHIFAGGSVTVPGSISIRGTDTPENSIRERVRLSDGRSIVNINGSARPTLDIRAGMRDVGLPGTTGGTTGFNPDPPTITTNGTSANIRIGDIQNPGGTVFLTNQYRPNQTLPGGNIRVGTINTSQERFTPGLARGGNVAIDARESVDIAGEVNTSARAGDEDVAALENRAAATGGNIALFAEGNITTQTLNTSAEAVAQATEIRPNEAGSAEATAQGGNIVLRTENRSLGLVAPTGNIETETINTSATATAEADVSTEIPETDGGTVSGDLTAEASSGSVTLSTNIVTGNIDANSDINLGNILIRDLESSANAEASALASASTAYELDATIDENVGNGGTILVVHHSDYDRLGVG